MSASRARRSAFVIILSLTLIIGLVPAVAAADSAPLPSSMAAVGDSITQAASSGGSLGADYPANSWSTGTNSTVNSHYLRLTALNPAITGNAYNGSVSGAKVAGLDAQMTDSQLVAMQPDYLTVLIGGNDLCTNTIGEMTSVTDFTGQFRTAMNTLLVGDSTTGAVSPETMVYVVGLPDIHQLWELFKNNFFARAVWSAGNICQSLLANPTSNQTADVERRKEFRERNIAYNTALEAVCNETEFASRCHYDADNTVFFTKFARGDVSGDNFHPSIEGQALLAGVTWTEGYSWSAGPAPDPGNGSPTADFDYSCTDSTCSFTDTSTDSDGTVVSHAWTFGDGADSTAMNPSHTYAADGTYTVSLTVTDDDGASASTSQSVTVSSGSVAISLSVNAYKVKGSQTADLTWSGANSTTVDIYRDGAPLITTANDGAYTDAINKKGGGSYVYKLCEAGTTTCSGEVTASY